MKSTRERRWSRVVCARAGARPEARMPASPAPAPVSHCLRPIMSNPPWRSRHLARGGLRADLLEELARPRIAGRIGHELFGEGQRAFPLAALCVEHGDGVGDVAVARIELEGLEQGRLRVAIPAQPVEGEAQVVAHPCPTRDQSRGGGEGIGGLGEPLVLREEETERVVELALAGRTRDPLAQDALRVPITPGRIVEGNEVRAGGAEVRIHAQRGQVLGLREIALPLARVEHGEVEMARRHVGHGVLRLNEFRGRRVEGRALPAVEALRRHRGEHARGLDAHGARGVVEERDEGGQALRGRRALQGGHGGDPYSRVGVPQRRSKRVGPLAGIATKETEGGSAYDGGDLPVAGHRHDAGCGVARARARRRKGERPLEPARPLGAVPLLDGGGGPLVGPVAMAARARVGGAESEREIRARRPQGVVAARVHHHVLLARHVAVDTLAARRAGAVEVMGGRIVELAREGRKAGIGRRAMALRAQQIALGLDPAAMGIVTVRAAHTALVHLALAERPVLIVLGELLAVDVIEIRAEGLRLERVVERATGMLAGRDASAPRVAGCAGVDLVARAGGPEGDHEARRPAVAALARPLDVAGAGAVAGLASDVDLAPLALISVRRCLVSLLEVRGVALCAHEVPVLVASRPVQRIVGRELLVGIERKPALSPHVPGHGKALESSPGKLHQILLERRYPEGVLDLEVAGLAVGALGAHEELAVTRVEARELAEVGEARDPEIAEHGVRGGKLHRLLVMRAPPLARLRGVALCADAITHVGHGTRRGAPIQAGVLQIPPAQGDEGGEEDDRGHDPPNHPAAPYAPWRRHRLRAGGPTQTARSSSAKRSRARPSAITTGPSTMPMVPKAARPPMRPKSTGKVEICARPVTTRGRTMLSTRETTTMPQKTRKVAAPRRPSTASVMAAGTHTREEPTRGTSAASEATTVKNTGEDSPTNAKLSPTRVPCTSAVSSVPKATARVMAERWPARSALRCGLRGTRRDRRAAAARPSRRKKKRRNRVRPTSKRRPTTPATTAPLEARTRESSDRPPSSSQVRSWTGGTGTNLPIHRRT